MVIIYKITPKKERHIFQSSGVPLNTNFLEH